MNKKYQIIVALTGFIVLFAFVFGRTIVNRNERIEDHSLLNVKERGVLIVGTTSGYEPMEYIDKDGNLVGFDMDLVKHIAFRLGVSAKFNDIEWSELFDAVKSGEVDIAISSITITSERSEEMLFSIPYFSGDQVIIVRAENDDIKSPEDLKDKKVGAQEGTTCEIAALQYVNPSSLFTKYNRSEYEIEDLKAGVIDAVVMDYIGAVGYIKNNPSLKIVGGLFTDEYYGIVTSKDNKALMNEINKILREMKRDGTLEELKERWLG